MLKPEEVEFLKEYARDCGLPEFARYALMLVEKHAEMELYPIYVPSYNVNEKRRTIQNLLAEGIPCTVCIYSNQVERYKELGCTDIIEVDPGVKTSYHNPVAYKRNLIIEDAQKRGASKIFMLDDDMSYVQLPYFVEKSYGAICEQRKVGVNLFFHLWQLIGDDKGYDMFALQYGRRSVRWAANRIIKEGATKEFPEVYAMFVLMSVTNIQYSTDNQWDDLDMYLKFFLAGKRCGSLLCYAETGGSSVLDYHKKERILNEHIHMIEKYGINVFEIRYHSEIPVIHIQRRWYEDPNRAVKSCVIPKNIRELMFKLLHGEEKGFLRIDDVNGEMMVRFKGKYFKPLNQ